MRGNEALYAAAIDFQWRSITTGNSFAETAKSGEGNCRKRRKKKV